MLLLNDIVDVPNGLPAPVLPNIDDVVFLLIPAFSLAFVGLVQGAAVSAGLPTPDGKPADTSRDFVGQGAGNIAAGLFQGMPVGGSMSGSSLMVAAGAKTRLAFIVAGVVMALVIFFASDLVSYVAMPALAGLLIVIGIGAIKPSRIFSVIKSGPLPTDDHGRDVRADARRSRCSSPCWSASGWASSCSSPSSRTTCGCGRCSSSTAAGCARPHRRRRSPRARS